MTGERQDHRIVLTLPGHLVAVFACIALLQTMTPRVALAQVPPFIVGPNVNMVSGTSLPDGDPWLQRQNEPSLAVSTRNACTLFAGANDYRTVDMPGVPGDIPGQAAPDGWLGFFKLYDCGRTWRTGLLPGYPLDTSPEGTASPLKGLAAAADPIVRAGTNGVFYYSGIAFNRGAGGASKVFVARFIDNNDGPVQSDQNPITYVGTTAVDIGTTGQFMDKPYIAVDIARGKNTK